MPRPSGNHKHKGVCFKDDCDGVRTNNLKAHDQIWHRLKTDGFLCRRCPYGASCFDLNLFSRHLYTEHGIQLSKDTIRATYTSKLEYTRPYHCQEPDCTFTTLTKEKLDLHSRISHIKTVLCYQELEEDIHRLVNEDHIEETDIIMPLLEDKFQQTLSSFREDVEYMVDELKKESKAGPGGERWDTDAEIELALLNQENRQLTPEELFGDIAKLPMREVYSPVKEFPVLTFDTSFSEAFPEANSDELCTSLSQVHLEENKPKKKRGRPKGSKNKPKPKKAKLSPDRAAFQEICADIMMSSFVPIAPKPAGL